VLKDTTGLSGMSASEKAAYANYRFLDTGAWKTWTEAQQKEFWKAVEQQKIPTPLPKPRDLGKDSRGVDLGSYTAAEYQAYRERERKLDGLRERSAWFRSERRALRIGEEGTEGNATDEDIEEERIRRRDIGHLQGKAMGRYEADPAWDDVVPIPQDDGEGALAAIAYTDEYAEGKYPPFLYAMLNYTNTL
jgi:protein farnesyltransferase/geranylgeranyltransferase type-1 subunit alpha